MATYASPALGGDAFLSQSQGAKRWMPRIRMEQVRDLFIVLVMGIGILSLAWVGYVGSDDHSYAQGAIAWLKNFPYVGDDHWTLRHPVVVPIAASLAIFGFHELSLGLPSAILFLALLVTNYHYLRRFIDARFALLTSLFMATTPLFAVQATFPQTTIVETLAVSLSFWLFYSAIRCDEPAWRMFASGVAAAFGLLTRETTAGILIFYGILFLIGCGVPRRYFVMMGLGLILIVGMEVAYFGILTGDPLYRYRIDLFHDSVDRVGETRAAVSSGSTLNVEGNLSVSPFLEPVVALLMNQEFGLLFWAFIPAAIWACRAKTIPIEDRRLLQLLSGMGLVWMAFISLNISVLYVVPRYYAVSTWAAVIIIAYWLHHLLITRKLKIAILTGIILLMANLLCIYVENKDPLFAERVLVKYVVQHDGVVYTDPMTMIRAQLLLDFEGASGRVLSDPAPGNALFFSNMKNVERCKRSTYRCKWSWEQYLPKENWIELTRIEPKRKLSGILLSWIGLEKSIPGAIFNRLDRPNTGGIIYLTGTPGL
jgi:4-amino-4-deoxy-L-arabinose transferase-like glycosyltransferase